MAKMTVYSLSMVQMKKIQDVMLKACAVSSDPHERRNDLGAVSTRDSVKLKSL